FCVVETQSQLMGGDYFENQSQEQALFERIFYPATRSHPMAYKTNRQSHSQNPVRPHQPIANRLVADVIQSDCRDDQARNDDLNDEAGWSVDFEGPAVTNMLTQKVAKEHTRQGIQATVRNPAGLQPSRRLQRGK